MARKFFYVCAGMFLLALSYHLGASTATAQGPGNPVVGFIAYGNAGLAAAAITANGDVYASNIGGLDHGWVFKQNIFNGGATPSLHESWGQLKARYAPNRGTAQPGAQSR